MRPLSDELTLIVAKSIAVFLVAVILGVGGWGYYAWVNEEGTAKNGDCNIATIPIEGDLMLVSSEDHLSTFADDVVREIRDAEADEDIKGILLVIDSPGGYVVASEIMMNAVRRAEKPTAALIRISGTSGAYLVASAADMVIASRLSDIGGIGVTQSYIETAGETERAGGKYIELTAGEHKDMGDPDRPLTDEERAILQRDLDITHEAFIGMIAENRNIPVEEVERLADGSSMLGDMALQNKLIDAIGDEDAAMDWFMDKVGEDEGVVICE